LRIDARGGGLFLGRARIDLVAVGGAECPPEIEE
jgi:hypothetical protein